ncbi:MAG: class II aldolase/adducin family protein [Actinobacteria bacterium]|nr:class II aldolase/adducin family protein [Actinomycetota bacterium]
MDDPREAVALGCRVLGLEDLGDLVFGHVSVRDPDGRGVWMKAAKLGFEEVSPDDVLLLDRDGNVLEGDGRRHAEFPIHTEIIAARPDVDAVVHTHGPYSVALGATAQPLRAISHEGTFFIPPEVPRFEETGDLILTPDLGRLLAETLGPLSAVMLVNHGIVTAGPDVPTAVIGTLLLERACRMQVRAASVGEVRRWSDDDEAPSKRRNVYSPQNLASIWEYLVRRLR